MECKVQLLPKILVELLSRLIVTLRNPVHPRPFFLLADFGERLNKSACNAFTPHVRINIDILHITDRLNRTC